MEKINSRSFLFFASLMSITTLGIYWVYREILFGEDEWLPWVWLVLFGILFFNVAYLFVISVLSLLFKNNPLPETEIEQHPKTALCYFIRNEDVELLYHRMLLSLRGNLIPNLDLWILSDSDGCCESSELELVKHLSAQFGERIYYRRRVIPVERKQGNIDEFVHSHPEYDFLYICDADSLVSRGAVERLLRKALHPNNSDIAIFQTFIKTTNAHTYYSRFEGIASETSQKLYFNTFQAIFGQTISFGHHLLVRRNLLAKIKLPKGLLSHDNWDTAILDQMGYRVAFVSDVVTYDEAPANYLETRKRDSRWSQGTLQGWPLVFMRELRPGVRFLSFYAIYCYLSQPIFLFWVLLGLISQSYLTGELLSFRMNTVLFGYYANEDLYFLFWMSLGVIFLHKLVTIRSWKDLQNYFYELAASTLIYSGNFFYSTLDMLSIPFKKLIWRPMKKNPFEQACFSEAFRMLLPGTTIGICGFLYFVYGTPFLKPSLFPILISLSFGIPIAVISSKSFSEERTLNVTN